MITEKGTKVCCKCGEEKPVTEFHKDKNSSDGYTYACKSCRNAKYNQYYTDNPEKKKEINDRRKEYRKAYYQDESHKARYKMLYVERKFGITKEEYLSLLESQNGVCAICGNPETCIRNKALAVDHSHITRRVRGLLCSNCNKAIGLLKDDPKIVQKALNYLRKYE